MFLYNYSQYISFKKSFIIHNKIIKPFLLINLEYDIALFALIKNFN